MAETYHYFGGALEPCTTCAWLYGRFLYLLENQLRHVRLTGLDDNGVFMTLKAQPYPQQFAAAVASLATIATSCSVGFGSYRYQVTTLDSFHRCGSENIPVFTTYLTAAAALNEVHNYLQAEPCIWQKKRAAPDESCPLFTEV